MFNISMEIDIKNYSELIKNQKGQGAMTIANVFLTKDKQKQIVEEMAKQEIVKALNERLIKEFRDNGVECEINIR